MQSCISDTNKPDLVMSLFSSPKLNILLLPFANAVKYGEVLMMQYADVSYR